MEADKRFDIKLHPNAIKEYKKLDNSVRAIVNNVIDELELRADEVGKILGNTNTSQLAGCKEIKLRDAGVRIVFKLTNEIVHVLRVVYIITINERDRNKVFKIADERLEEIRHLSPEKKRFHYVTLKNLRR